MFGPALSARQHAIFQCLQSKHDMPLTIHRIADAVGLAIQDVIRELFELHEQGVIVWRPEIPGSYEIRVHPLPAPLLGSVDETGMVHWAEPSLI